MTAAEPTRDVREQIHRHGVYGFTGTEIACCYDRWWRSTAEHEAHLADAVLALRAVRDALAAQETVRRVEAVAKDYKRIAARHDLTDIHRATCRTAADRIRRALAGDS